MKKLIFMLLLCFSFTLAFSQRGKVDQIVKKNGFVIKAKVISYKGDQVTYQLPGESFVMQVKKQELSKIIFHDGKEIEFSVIEDEKEDKDDDKVEVVEENVVIKEENTDRKAALDSTDWVNIKITEDPEEVNGLFEMGEVVGFAEGSKLNTPTGVLLSNAMVDLKMEAALISANIVLIIEIKHTRGYGDLPTTEIEAIGYKK